MPKRRDLTGQRFGYLIPVKIAPNRGKRTTWYCKCTRCNRNDLIIIPTESLTSGNAKSCGCLRRDQLKERNSQNFKDYTGERFGLLTCIERVGSIRDHAAWKCKCDCGNEIITDTGSLKAGYIKSCGCLKKSYGEKKIEDILQNQQVLYKKEYTFPDLYSPKNKNSKLRFDFAIFLDNKLCYLIEYDGEQHYLQKSDLIFSDTLPQRQLRDKIKNEYCLANQILLYRIPFWELKNINNLQDILQEKYLVKERG